MQKYFSVEMINDAVENNEYLLSASTTKGLSTTVREYIGWSPPPALAVYIFVLGTTFLTTPLEAGKLLNFGSGASICVAEKK